MLMGLWESIQELSGWLQSEFLINSSHSWTSRDVQCEAQDPAFSPSLNLVEIQIRGVEIQEISHSPGTPGCVTFFSPPPGPPGPSAPCREATSPA